MERPHVHDLNVGTRGRFGHAGTGAGLGHAFSRLFVMLISLGVPLALGTALLNSSRTDTPAATVTVDGFTLTCSSSATEGSTLTCTLANTNDAAAEWPVVGLLHRSSDSDRALVRGSPLDVEFGTLDPSATIDGSVWYQGDLLIAYSRFDWGGMAAAADETGSSRTVSISVLDDSNDESRERFYVSLAPDGSKGVGILNSAAVAVFVDDNDDQSTDASLSDLRISAPSGGLSLSFASDVLAYRASVGYEVTEVTVAADAARSAASVTVDGTALAREEGSSAISLGPGSTAIEVVVTAEDGSTSTYSLVIERGERPENVSVTADGWSLQCPSVANEGTTLTCTLTNTNSGSSDWPVVAIIHSSLNDNRALITEDLLIPDTSSLYSRDLRLQDPQDPAVENYNYGYGRLLSGGSWTEADVYGYEKFDWSESAAADASRSVEVDILSNVDADSSSSNTEIFYVALAPSDYTGLSNLVDNKVPIVIVESAYADQFASGATTRVSNIGPEAATVTITAPSGLTSSRMYLRYRISGAAWTRADPATVSNRTAVFNLEGLDPASEYEFQAALEPFFSARASGSLTTLTPTITKVEAPTVDDDSATVTVSVANAVAATRVYLRYRAGSSGDWTAATPVAPTSNTASFTLSVLSADTDYQVQAALDNSFDSPTTKTFRTHPPPPAITDVVASDATADTVTVTVSVANAVAATRVHLQYRSGGGNWTAATPVAPTSNTAAFTLSVPERQHRLPSPSRPRQRVQFPDRRHVHHVDPRDQRSERHRHRPRHRCRHRHRRKRRCRHSGAAALPRRQQRRLDRRHACSPRLKHSRLHPQRPERRHRLPSPGRPRQQLRLAHNQDVQDPPAASGDHRRRGL